MANPRDPFAPPNAKKGVNFAGDFTGGAELEDFGDKGTRVEYQEKSHRFFTRTPRVGEVAEKEFVLASISGTFKLFTKINGKLYTADLTEV